MEQTEYVQPIIVPEKEKKFLTITGEIDHTTSKDFIDYTVSRDWEKGERFDIYISSPGGDLSDCFAVIDLAEEIRKKGVHIVTHGLGEVISAAFFIFLLGDERIVYPKCSIYVHEHITMGAEGQTFHERIKADKEEETMVYEQYVKYTAQRLGITNRRAKNFLRKSRWLSRKEITDYGIPKALDHE